MNFPAELTPLLAGLLDQVPLRVAVVDGAMRYRYVNQTALDFLQRRAEDLLGRTVAEARGAEIGALYAPLVECALAGEVLQHSAWVDYPLHGRRFVEDQIQALPAAPGTPREERLIVAYSRDSTAMRLQAEQADERLAALQRAERLKSAIVDNALAALVTSDAQGRIVEFNPAAEAMFGRSRARALGATVAEVMIPPRLRGAHEEGMARMARGEAPRVMGQRLELAAQRADGSEFPIEMVLWRTDVGAQSYFTASIIDMSERVKAQQLIQRQREALRQSEKLSAMGSLLAGVAHELNNPLAIVMGRASLLEEKTAGSDLALEAARIREAAERCGRIVRTFLNMARSKPMQRAPVALNELVHAAVDLLQYGLRSHGIELQLNLHPALPLALADGDQLGQIVLNLMVNAQQALATVEGPRLLRLSTGVESRRSEREPRVWLRVQDSGPGVPEALHGQIFEPYFTTKPEGLGTGLGLAVSRSLARDHGGDLQLENPAEGGACLRLSLPISGVQSEPEESMIRPAPLPPEDPARARLLVVDDEPEIVDLLRALLERAGYEVSSAESGAVALELLEMARFDAVISDLRMPDLDGAGLWRALQTRWPALTRRLLFVTGDTLSPGARSFLDETGCPHLDKPFGKAELLGAVEALLGPAQE